MLNLHTSTIVWLIGFFCYVVGAISWFVLKWKRREMTMVWAGLAIPLFLASGILKLIFGFAIKNPGPEDIFLEIVATVGGILVSVSLFSDARKKPKEESEQSEPIPEPDTDAKEEGFLFFPDEPLTRQRIENCVRNLLEEGRGKPKTGDDVLDLDFYNAVGLDSLDTIELIIDMNTSLGTNIDSEIMEKEGIRNGRELVEMVVKELVVY